MRAGRLTARSRSVHCTAQRAKVALEFLSFYHVQFPPAELIPPVDPTG